MTKAARVLPLGLLLLVFAAPSVSAQPLDLSQGGPITVSAQGGIEWRQNQKEVIAHGAARATRGAVTITADALTAHYRPKRGTETKAASAAPGDAKQDVMSGEEIYRLIATGNVHIFTATDQAFGERAVYDLDESVLVLTGHHLRLTTPDDVLTARDDVEYWPTRHMAVARGDAVVVTNDGRRLSADTLVAYTSEAKSAGQSAVHAASAKPSDNVLTGGNIKRIDAFGHVTVRTTSATVTGERGVYVPETGIALILGNVHITRGQNQLNGARGVVDMKTGVAELLAAPEQRVQGLVVPNSAHEVVPEAPTKAAPGGSRAGSER